jgi:formylmethanofuran dehydrogenase subunit E
MDEEDEDWEEDEDEDFDDEDWADEEDLEEGFDFGDEDSTIYEVECPVCGEVINFDEDTLEDGAIPCPNCGENLEFSFEDEDEE